MFIYSIIDKISLIKHSKGLDCDCANALTQVDVMSLPICISWFTPLALIGNYIGLLLVSVISRGVRQAVSRARQ